MPETNEVEVQHEGPITIITINHPQVRNAVNKSTATALRKAWMDFEMDENALVGILTGGDEVFCAGADLHDINQFNADIQGPSGPLGFTRLSVSKPTIAAIAGYCVAGGLELACWCDLRIADESAIFGCFERRFGVPLIDGGTQRLPRIIGLGRALEMILTGRPVAASEALAFGLANEVVPRGQSLMRAVALGHMLAKFPQTCLRNDRQATYLGLSKDLAEGLRLEAALGAETLKSGEAAAGSMRFQQGQGRKGDFNV
ncbi:MAG TPA: crotonase/enoyl-CoA hydratase family protein [Ktedonobacteraceae bacterium]|nr:crotonase/enoyl-CoA hydratase family protein [Ktedonobacteraceae bacterium]